jgi:hypothetical protein
VQVAPSGKTVWVISGVGLNGSTAENTITPVAVASNQPGPSFRTSGWLNPNENQPSGAAMSPEGRVLYLTVGPGLETFRLPDGS